MHSLVRTVRLGTLTPLRGGVVIHLRQLSPYSPYPRLSFMYHPEPGFIDTPGIRSFGLAHVPPEQIVQAFPDLVPGEQDCPKGCHHTAQAVDCGINTYVQAGKAGASGAARLDSLRKLAGCS